MKPPVIEWHRREAPMPESMAEDCIDGGRRLGPELGAGLGLVNSRVSAIGSQLQVFSTRFGYGFFPHLHPNLNTRTRYLTTETRDLEMNLDPMPRSPVSR